MFYVLCSLYFVFSVFYFLYSIADGIMVFKITKTEELTYHLIVIDTLIYLLELCNLYSSISSFFSLKFNLKHTE